MVHLPEMVLRIAKWLEETQEESKTHQPILSPNFMETRVYFPVPAGKCRKWEETPEERKTHQPILSPNFMVTRVYFRCNIL